MGSNNKKFRHQNHHGSGAGNRGFATTSVVPTTHSTNNSSSSNGHASSSGVVVNATMTNGRSSSSNHSSGNDQKPNQHSQHQKHQKRPRESDQPLQTDLNNTKMAAEGKKNNNNNNNNGKPEKGGASSTAAPNHNNDQNSASTSNALPVVEARQSIVRMVTHNSAVIIVGETGSGKTTQIPQYVLDEVIGSASGKMVGVTQPRRVAAVSIARYVASQRKGGGGVCGQEVGYSVRFDDQTSPKTRLKFMTDGILLREILADPQLEKYGAIILDEAHERTLHGDVLFGLLKALTRTRRDLKIIIMSATLNAKHFSVFWRNAPIGVVHGRSFPVTIMHATEPQADYVDAAINTILQIHTEEGPGDILCFLTGQEEIEDTKRVLENRLQRLPAKVPEFVVLTIYAAMPYEKQLLVFDKTPNGQRKVILATNIAETSITIEGIKYVVDSGMVKSKTFNAKTNMEALTEAPVSRAQCVQRTGRAGRMSAGKCFRLFTEDGFESLSEETIPEIKRCSLNSVVLQMKAMGINDILGFEFLDVPPPEAIIKAQEVLALIGALNPSDLSITPLGRRLAAFPIEPQAAKTLLAGHALGVADDTITVLALLATENIFAGSKSDQDSTDRCKAQFAKAIGDHVTLLNVFRAYQRQGKHARRTWCESYSINYRQMLRAEDIMLQLRQILATTVASSNSNNVCDGEEESLIPESMRRRSNGDSNAHGNHSNQNGSEDPEDLMAFDEDRSRTNQQRTSSSHNQKNTSTTTSSEAFSDSENLRRAFCIGFFLNAAYYDAKLQNYRTIVGHQPVHLHPSSVVFTMTKRKPALLLYNSVVQTTRRYMKDVIIVRSEWLTEAAPMFFQASA